jgi:hypothetical protein
MAMVAPAYRLGRSVFAGFMAHERIATARMPAAE